MPTVFGAAGFIGGFVVAALRRAGCNVLCGVRPGPQLSADERGCDLQTLCSAPDWLPLLQGVDAVVNAAGLLRDRGGQTLQQVHEQAPLALAQACVQLGINSFVQISAMGEPADGEFVASKHRFDAALLQLPLRAVVLRPSVIYSTAGSFGGTSLLRALAAFPLLLPLPGDGCWQIQPAAAEDLAELVVRAVQSPLRGLYPVGCAQAVSLREYQLAWRHWLRIGGRRVFAVPEAIVTLGVIVGEWLGRGPLGAATWRLLRRGAAMSAHDYQRLRDDFGMAPRDLSALLAERPSQVQDRWQAQLYLLAPLLRLCVIALWLVSALAGFLAPAAEIERLASQSWLAQAWPVPLARAAAAMDLVLALWLMLGWRPRLAIGVMLAMLVAYTAAFGLGLPWLWLDPLGGLAKNLVLLPALAVLWVDMNY